MKIGFLFNHEQIHQIPHAITVAFELSRLSCSVEVLLISSSGQQAGYIKEFESRFPDHKCKHVSISVPWYIGIPGRVLDKCLPITKIAILRENLSLFKSLDALVVPEKTSLYLKTRYGLDRVKYIYTAHGAGDREIGFNEKFTDFDFIFLSGEKIRKRMYEAGILDKVDSAVVGYPKFDAVAAFTRERKSFFDNDKPVVLYNPHFVPHLSSWYKMGMDILEYFYTGNEYNLIFAPHVMLYTRKMHISEETFRTGRVRRIPKRFYDCRNIHIDTGSAACTDMTYTLAADIYLGDVSSQLHEFLLTPRPCLFANAHQSDWEEDPNFLHWHAGPVFDDVKDLGESLHLAVSSHAKYKAFQEELFGSSFDITDVPSSRRAANAILEFMNRSMTAARGKSPD